jgi:YfiH family protein
MIQSDLLRSIPGLVHGFSDRTDGNMSIKATEIQYKLSDDFQSETYLNRQAFFDRLHIDATDVVLSRQTHNTVVERVEPTHKNLSGQNISPFSSADGLFAFDPHTYLAIFTADCLPIFFVDPATRAIAAVHAGWRGIAGEIIAETCEALRQNNVKPADLQVWIGPHIQACHYKLEQHAPSYQEKQRAFQDTADAFMHRNGEIFLDLTTLAVRQLEKQGITRANREIGECTACFPEKYYSYYMDKGNVSGIMMGVIGWEADND